MQLSYRDAGVDIEAGEGLVSDIRADVEKTRRPEVLGGLGGFGALFQVPLDRYREPVLVSGTDGVGTKLKLAFALEIYNTIGIDLVAMCVNDVLVQGAEPLFFLDYYATGKLERHVAAQVIQGIAAGCAQAGASLVGGETAEMPGMYQVGEFDLAGFCVGIVEKSQILDGSAIQAGDVVLGLASSGPHSNGYSLIRKIISVNGNTFDEPFGENTLGETLLKPTKIYVKSLLPLVRAGQIRGLAHITGGGLTENIPRVLPEGLGVRLGAKNWTMPPIFDWLQSNGNIAQTEMYKTFNCGIGMVVIVSPEQAEAVQAACVAAGETVFKLGVVEANSSEARVVIE